jgi:hypothetical protein
VSLAGLFIPGSSFSADTTLPGISVRDNAIITDDLWGVQLRFDGCKPWVDHPLYGRPNFVLAARSDSGSCTLMLSMFAETVPPGTTPEKCRTQYMGNPEAIKKGKDMVLLEHQSAPLAYTLFDIRPKGRPPVSNQAYGYWTRNDVCFELHVSSTSCDDFKVLAMPVLESVRLSPDRGATPETVYLARKSGGDPGDWKLHTFVAGQYLHAVKPPVLARARRFYESAQYLAGSQLDAQNRWLIEEGIGLAWLFEDNGEKALPFLSRALEVARSSKEQNRLSSTLYNLACAHSLQGNTKQACGYLSEALSVQDEKAKQPIMKQIVEDKQLLAVRSSECYRELALKHGLRRE